MAIRQSPIPWTKYKKAAKTLKTIYPGITPQQIIGRIGYPTKNGKRIRITSDGQGGIKERSLDAKGRQERLRQKRRRIQTGKLSIKDAAESRRIKDEKPADKEVDHFNELSFIGEQLEDLEKRGGDVNAALTRLREAGYTFGDEPGNLQYLSPEDNKLKNQESRRLQRYLGSREALGQSPSARRPDLILTDFTPETLGGFQVEERGLTSTAGAIRYKPEPLEGIATDYVPMQPTVEPKQDLSQQVMETVSTAAKVGGAVLLTGARGVVTIGAGYLLK